MHEAGNGTSTHLVFSLDLPSLTRLGLVELRRIEAAEVIASDLARSRNVVYLPTGQNLLLNVSGAAQ